MVNSHDVKCLLHDHGSFDECFSMHKILCKEAKEESERAEKKFIAFEINVQ